MYFFLQFLRTTFYFIARNSTIVRSKGTKFSRSSSACILRLRFLQLLVLRLQDIASMSLPHLSISATQCEVDRKANGVYSNQARIEGVSQAEEIEKHHNKPEDGANSIKIQTDQPVHPQQALSVSQAIAFQDDSGNPGADQDGIPPEPLYCILSEPAKISIILIASFAAIISPISGSIYFPALDSLAHDLDVSVSLITLTITAYLVR